MSAGVFTFSEVTRIYLDEKPHTTEIIVKKTYNSIQSIELQNYAVKESF